MGSTIILFALIILAIVLVRWNKRRREYNALSPLQKAYHDWKKAFPEDSKMGTAAKALNELVIAELAKEMGTQGLKQCYHGLIYWDADTEKYGKDVTDFYSAKFAELEQKERAEAERLQAWQRDEEEAREEAFLQHAQEATTAKQSCAVFCSTPNNGPAEKLALEKWDRFSLLDVLKANTAEELLIATDEAREGSLAGRLTPFMRERLAKHEAVVADTIDTIILAGENAPEETVPEHTALRIVFEKLYERRNSITAIMH